MQRTASSIHLFLTFLLLVGLLFGAIGPTLVSALGEKTGLFGGINAVPVPVSFMLQNPISSPTNADTLTFRVTFSETVFGVEPADFIVHDNAPDPTTNAPGVSVTSLSNRVYDVRIYGGNLGLFNGEVGLDFSGPNVVNDAFGAPISTSEPPIDETYDVDNTNPTVVEFKQATGQLDPATTQPINLEIEFSEEIDSATFTASDITQGGNAPSPTWEITDTGDHINFTLSATTTGNGTIIPLILAGRVQDLAGNGNEPFIEPCNIPADDFDHCVTLDDTIRPSLIITQAGGQADPADTQPVLFKVVFYEVIDPASFTADDIKQPPGTAHVSSWLITDLGDHHTFWLSARASENGLIMPQIEENSVFDFVGLGNTAFDGGCSLVTPDDDNCVTLYDTVRPGVTVEQSFNQDDPTSEFPIKFTVEFSEIIDPENFTTENVSNVIFQAGTAKVITWVIVNKGNNKDFILYATDVTTDGTLIPIVKPNVVTDLVGINPNLRSTSTDNTVTYKRPYATPTPTAISRKSVVITEVAWMGTAASASDEWIELYNTTNQRVYMDGWHLVSFRYGSTTGFTKNLDITFGPNDYIDPRNSTDIDDPSGYYLIEHARTTDDNDAVKNIKADKTYTQSTFLNDTGEILLLCSKQNVALGQCNINQKNLLVDYVNATLAANGSINRWPAGSGYPQFGSMERKNLISDEPENWFTHPLVKPRFGHTRDWDETTDGPGEHVITGTPKHPNWSFNVTATPPPPPTPTRTPTRLPPITLAPILVINEVLARSGSDWNNDGKVDVYDEFIEVMNAGSINLNLNTYKLDDALNQGSSPFSLPNQTLKPGEKAVFYGSQTGILLEDSGDIVRLLKASNNAVVDQVTYPVVKLVDSSLCRYTDGYGSWIMGCFPTPGRPNALTGDRYPSTSNGLPIRVCLPARFRPERVCPRGMW